MRTFNKYVILTVSLSVLALSQDKPKLIAQIDSLKRIQVIDINTLNQAITQAEKNITELNKEVLVRQGELGAYYNLRTYYQQNQAAKDTTAPKPSKLK